MKSQIKLKKTVNYLFYIIIFWILIGFIVMPLLNTIKSSFLYNGTYSLHNYIEFFSNHNNKTVILNTFKLGVSTVVVCGIIGISLAFYMSFVKVKFKKFIHILLLSPMMVPGVIIVISFIQLYGESGIVTKSIELLFGLSQKPYNFAGFKGILFVHAYTQYVYFYLNISVALKYVDYATIEAAKGLGASKVHILFTIIVPAVMPAVLSSIIVTFISGIGSFSAPNLIGGRYKVLSTQILLSKANNFINIASLQVVVLLVMGLFVLLLVRHYEKKCVAESSVRGVRIEPVNIDNKLAKCCVNMTIVVIVVLIVLPIVTIIFLSFVKPGTWMIEIFPKEFSLDNYVKLINKKRVMKPFVNSIFMSLSTVVIGTIISLPVAYLSAKKKNKINNLTELIIMLPWAMPVSTIAINLINTFNTKNIFAFNKILIGTYWILPIAYIIMSLPLLTRTNIIAMGNFNTTLEDASKSLGASGLRTFFNITVPVVSPGILSGGTLIFIRTLGEYTMSALLYGASNRPISIAMVNAMNEFDIGLSMTYGVLTIAICFAAMMLILKLDKEKNI